MVKCRTRSSFIPLVSSIIGRRDAASLKFSVALLNRFRFRVEDLRQTLHSSAVDDEDSFSELGQQLEPRRKGFLKLMTEKTDNITKHNHGSKNKFAPCKVVKDSTEHCSTVKDNVVCSNKQSPKGMSGTCNGPFISSMFQKKKEIKKQSQASAGVQDELESCAYEPEIQGSQQFMQARIQVESSNLLIHPWPADEIFTVRISDFCTNTSDYTVCAVCGSFCILLGIKRTGKTSVDAVFRVKDHAKRKKLLKRLSSTIKDDCHWTAQAKPSRVSSPAKKKNKQGVNLGIDIERQITDMRDEIIWKKLLCDDDDLIKLHMSLEGQHEDVPEAD